MHQSIIIASIFGWFAIPLSAQESSADFDAPVIVVGPYERIDETLDLNGDAHQDAFGFFWKDSGRDEYRVRGYRNPGDGSFQQIWQFDLPTGVTGSAPTERSAVGDFDNDGLDDFAISFYWFIHIFVTNGTAAPSAYAVIADQGTVEGFAVADFNGDGLDDVATDSVNSVKLYLNQGAGQPFLLASEESYQGYGGGGFNDWVELTDANGDQTPDVSTGISSGFRLFPVIAGVLQPLIQITLPGVQNPMLVSGDIDGDGDTDIVGFDADRTYAVARRTGPTTFEVEPVRTGGPATNFADVDADGDLDGVCCGGGGGGNPANENPSIFRISKNNGRGGFSTAFEMAGLGALHLAGAGDFDGDGDVDLVAGRAVYYSQGGIAEAPRPLVGDALQSSATLYDLDNDGDLDAQSGRISAFLSDGAGGYSAGQLVMPTALPGESYGGQGHPGDWDGDGDIDLLVSHSAGSVPTGMRLLRNHGGGGFSDAGPATAYGVVVHSRFWEKDLPEATLAADADGDGDLDVFRRAIQATPIQTDLWFNDGAASFSRGPSFPSEMIRFVTDLNGDTVPDLVFGSYTLSYRLGLGAGAFGPSQVLPIELQFGSYFDLADLDGDGDADICAVDRPSTSTFLFLNDGQANFTLDTPFIGVLERAADGHGAHAMDVNGDGLTDLVLSPARDAGTAAAIALRKADNSGWEPTHISMAHGTVKADLDGDGDLDLVSDQLTRNRTHQAPRSGQCRPRFSPGASSIRYWFPMRRPAAGCQRPTD